MPDETRSPVLIATDGTEHALPAIVRGHALAAVLEPKARTNLLEAASLIVIHVIPDELHRHPLLPSLATYDAVRASTHVKEATEAVTAQVRDALGSLPDALRVVIEMGQPADEIVRVAEEVRSSLVVVGAKPRHGAERVLGHVAERVVRYAHTSVLVARAGPETRKILIATDFTEGSLPALQLAAKLVEKTGVEATLLHVMQLPKATALTAAASALGSPWAPPPKVVIEQLEELGRKTLEGFAQQYRFAHVEQLEGDPAAAIMARAQSLDAEMILMGSHGRTGLRRLVLGSTAEKVIRESTRSVLVARR
jgi:nucleotide-binding universal stress UspA family protein